MVKAISTKSLIEIPDNESSMKSWHYLFCTFLASGLSSHVHAAQAATANAQKPETGQEGDRPVSTTKTFNTGVAKGRDLLDSAISASTLDETDLPKVGTTSAAGIIGNLPGIRAETSGIDGFSALTVRGLPLSADGSKYLQIQEDGLPVLEFGDIHFASADMFVRADISLSQIQAIRGGSASTFASNTPGGVINFISKTGEVEGGAIQVASGLDHDLKRIDFDYGAPLGEGWRFHVGGFYREGEGPRKVGFNGIRGGQAKLNITRQFANGFVRFYGKYMDDRQPNYGLFPVSISGTNAEPTLTSLPGTDARRDTFYSRYIPGYPSLDQTNDPNTNDLHQGIRGIVKSVGFEVQMDIGGWTVSDKFRFADISGAYNEKLSMLSLPAQTMAETLGGAGAVLTYAGGPNAGQVVTNGSSLNGNGLLSVPLYISANLNSLGNRTNDLRASRVWALGQGNLTTTAGVYTTSQDVDMYWTFTSALEGFAANGSGTRFNLTKASGVPVTDNGILGYGIAIGAPLSTYHRQYDLNYRVIAPYGSANYQLGRLSIGGSLRLDYGKVTGSLYGSDLGGGRNGVATIDVNGDGVISVPEAQVAILPNGQPGNANYKYDYLSYSAGVNYRVADPLSVFARYSRGGRAAGERVAFSPALDSSSGALTDPTAAFGSVKQAEAGVKLRRPGMTVFLTGFWAATTETGVQIGGDASGNTVVTSFSRSYSAKGLELESEFRKGPFSLSLGATYAKSKIARDNTDASLNGNRPRHQPELFFNARPQVEQSIVTVGATINGTTSSFAQDNNVLKQPGYVIVNPFLFVRPVPRLQLGLTAFNVFDRLAFVNIASSAVPASGLVNAQVLNGRTVTASARFSF